MLSTVPASMSRLAPTQGPGVSSRSQRPVAARRIRISSCAPAKASRPSCSVAEQRQRGVLALAEPHPHVVDQHRVERQQELAG